jgi:ABC-type multidrug transport system fused ATPase/permease subunit
MSDIVEGLGTAVEGGLFAKAVSEKPGGGPAFDKGHFAEGACLNCGTPLVGEHCHACGQKAHLHRTLSAFMHDVAHGAVHFDSKTWRTLPMLAVKPGELTRRYIDGERTRFVSPMALFLFSIFLMFAVFQFAGISAPTDFNAPTSEEASEGLAKKLTELEADIERAEERLETEELTDGQRSEIERRLTRDREEYAQLNPLQELPFFAREDEPAEPDPEPGSGAEPAGQDAEASSQPASEIVTGSDIFAPDEDWNVNLEETGWVKAAVQKWEKNPGLMLYKLQTNFYKFSWLLIPLSIPFVWVMFLWKRRFRAYDHAIFVTYSLSFMTMLILGIVLAGLAGAPTPYVVLASLLVPPIHIYKHLRGAYELSRFSAFWRLSVLSVLIVIILGMFTSLLMLLGLF